MNVPDDYRPETLNVPRGVTGRHRQDYLTLTNDQKRVYRFAFDKCGKYASHAYQIATDQA